MLGVFKYLKLKCFHTFALFNQTDLNSRFEAVKPLRPRPEREFNEYEGDDADEKADLEDEKWEEQKSLK